MDIQLLHTVPCTNEFHTNHRSFRDVLDCKPTTREAAPFDEILLPLRLRRERILDMITEQGYVHVSAGSVWLTDYS